MNLISQNIESFSNILNNECKPLFGKRLNINSKAMDGQQDWFDNDCKTKHVDFKKAFTYVRLNYSDMALGFYCFNLFK